MRILSIASLESIRYPKQFSLSPAMRGAWKTNGIARY
jgi:hypothetical protein